MGICIRVYVADNERELNVVVLNDDSKRDKSKENPSKVVADFLVPLSVIPKNESVTTVSDDIEWEDVKIERTINDNYEDDPAPDIQDNFIDVNDVVDRGADTGHEQNDVDRAANTSHQIINVKNTIAGGFWRPSNPNVTEFVLPDMSRQLTEQLKRVNQSADITRRRVSSTQKRDVQQYAACSGVTSYYESSCRSSKSFQHSPCRPMMNGNQDPTEKNVVSGTVLSSGYSQTQSQETFLSYDDFSQLVDVSIEESSAFPHSVFEHSYTDATAYCSNRNKMMKEKYRCNICSYTCGNSKSLTAHKIRHTKRHVCPYCNVSLPGKTSLKDHVREHPEAKRMYKCEMCPYQAMSKHQLTLHRRRHSLPNQISCSYCGYIAKSRGIMDIHERSHTNEKPFVCSHCDFKGISQSSLNLHTRQFHKESKSVKKLELLPLMAS